jgi:hypothetical protein
MIVVATYDFLFNLSIQFEYKAPDSITHIDPSPPNHHGSHLPLQLHHTPLQRLVGAGQTHYH